MDTTPVVNISYITVGIGFVICTIYAVFAFVKIKALPEHLIPNKTAGQIMHGNWHLMLPLAVLILLVILQTAAGINLVQMATGPLMGWLSNITILKGLSNNIVTFLITATLVSLFFKPVRKNLPKVVKTAWWAHCPPSRWSWAPPCSWAPSMPPARLKLCRPSPPPWRPAP